MIILIAGPYRSGTNDDPALMKKNLDYLESVALPLFRKGHIPMIGEWLALPLIRLAGSTKPGDAAWEEIQYSVAHLFTIVWKIFQVEVFTPPATPPPDWPSPPAPHFH